MFLAPQAILSKKQQKAKADTTEVRAKKDLEDAQASLLVDKQFLEDAKVKCEAHAAEYAERVKVRNEELVGCSKAAAILSDDSARDTFSRTFNAAFLQLGRANRTQAEQAAAVLAKAAAKSHDARLVAVSHMVRTDAFDQPAGEHRRSGDFAADVLGFERFQLRAKEIDSMVRQLKKVQQEEVSSKDSCVQRLHENSLDTTKSSNSKAQMDSKIEELKSEMKTAKTDMELRQNESSEIIKDQKHTQELLSRALEVLGNAGPDAGSSAVMLLLQQIIGDAKVLQAKAETDFEAAVKDYKQFKDDATVAITTKEQSLVDLGVEKSESKADLLEAHAEATELEKELASLGETKAALREECDLLMNKFDLRQEAREQEIDALVTAKSILSHWARGSEQRCSALSILFVRGACSFVGAASVVDDVFHVLGGADIAGGDESNTALCPQSKRRERQEPWQKKRSEEAINVHDLFSGI
eukprot:g2340.t1